jgi:YebC/PmpR family DNA-binding regulatory protein
MSGHSKWATIKRAKAKTDQARGKAFSKIAREITTAAKTGGDPASNAKLRLLIDKARAANMPNDNVKRAIDKGVGGGKDSILEEVTYEGYAASGVAILVEVVTDNKGRTLPEVRNVFSKNGGNLGTSGSVNWMFKKKGIISFDLSKVNEDQVSEIAIENGADDLNSEEGFLTISTTPESYEKVLNALKAAKFEPESAEISMEPTTTVKVDGEDAQKVLKLVNALEDLDDVTNVYGNFDISADILNKQ